MRTYKTIQSNSRQGNTNNTRQYNLIQANTRHSSTRQGMAIQGRQDKTQCDNNRNIEHKTRQDKPI